MFGCDKEERIEIYSQDIHTTHFFTEVPTIVGWKLRQRNNIFLQHNVLPYSKAPFLISYPNRCFSPVSLWKWLHFLSSIQSYTYPWKLSRTKILTETYQTRDYALWNSFLILRCTFICRFSKNTVPSKFHEFNFCVQETTISLTKFHNQTDLWKTKEQTNSGIPWFQPFRTIFEF